MGSNSKSVDTSGYTSNQTNPTNTTNHTHTYTSRMTSLEVNKHNMATTVDKDAIKEAYNEVMADKNNVEWAAFTFDTNNTLGVTATGDDFATFKSHFGPDDRGFGYIKIMTGDEMSKRSKFVFCTWVGPNVSVMKKAKMSTDKALLKEIITNFS